MNAGGLGPSLFRRKQSLQLLTEACEPNSRMYRVGGRPDLIPALTSVGLLARVLPLSPCRLIPAHPDLRTSARALWPAHFLLLPAHFLPTNLSFRPTASPSPNRLTNQPADRPATGLLWPLQNTGQYLRRQAIIITAWSVFAALSRTSSLSPRRKETASLALQPTVRACCKKILSQARQ